MSLEISPSFLLNFSEREMNGEAKHFYQFKSFRLDVEERQLLHNGDAVPLTPRAFDVLAALVQRGGRLVEKDELLRLVWSDSFVEEANVARIIHTLRKVLGEDAGGNKFIETVAKKGYRFVADVTEVGEPAPQESANGNHNFSTVADKPSEIIVGGKFAETDFQIPPTAIGKTESDITEGDKIADSLADNQSHTTRYRTIAVGFLGAVLLLLLFFAFNFQSESSLKSNDVKSIAVLPVQPLAAQTRDSLYELGIQDSLINKLSLVKGLIVRPLSATRQYADVQQDALAAGREQRVDYVLASNYQIADGKIRITSQLIDVRSGRVEGVFKDEQNNSSIFVLQDAVAANISQSLLERLNREPNNLAVKRHTTSEEAYRLYLLGTALADKRGRKNAEKAVEYFQEAVRLDPHYAPAYAGMANAHTQMAIIAGGDTHEHYLRAKAAIEKALAIDDNLAEAHSYSGEIKWVCEWDFAGAEREHKKAIALDPNSSAAHRMYALYLVSMKRYGEAVAEIKTAVDLEPALGLNHRIHGQILFYDRRYDEAVALFKQTLEMDADFLSTYGWLINSYRLKREDDRAFEWFVQSRAQSGEKPDEIQTWKTIYAESGWRGVSERQLEKALEDEKNGKPNYVQLAFYAIELGRTDEAFAYLEKVFAERKWIMTTLLVNPRFDSLRSDSRFDDLVKRVGFK